MEILLAKSPVFSLCFRIVLPSDMLAPRLLLGKNSGSRQNFTRRSLGYKTSPAMRPKSRTEDFPLLLFPGDLGSSVIDTIVTSPQV